MSEPNIDILNIIKNIKNSPILKTLKDVSSERDLINLAIGEPHFNTPEEIKESMIRAIRDGKTKYAPPQGILPLRERIAMKYFMETRSEVSPDNIIIGVGASNLLDILFLSTINANDYVLLIEPYYLAYKNLVEIFKGQILTVPENFDAEDLAKIPTPLKMILYSNPSNPTGYILKRNQINALANLAEKTGAVLVSDEVYSSYDYENKFISTGSIYPKAVTLISFSKSHGMTGFRLGAAIATKEIIKRMVIVQENVLICAPTPIQWGGITALDIDISYQVNEYKRNRDRWLDKYGRKIEFGYPDGGIFVFPKIGCNDNEFLTKALLKKGLIVAPGNSFTKANNYIRISYCVSEEVFSKGLNALSELFDEFEHMDIVV